MTKPAKELGANVKPSWAFALRGEGTDALELDIFDIVGGGFFSDGVTAKGVNEKLAANAQAKTIKVRISSKGGDVIDGNAIFEMLRDHGATIDVQIVGMAASIASVIAMAGDTISISSSGFVMIHDPYVGLTFGGSAKELRRKADVIDQMRDTIADIYVDRTGQTKADILSWMAAETWMRPAQAKERGFVDAILAAKPAKGKAAVKDFAALNMADLDVFDNVPEEVRELVSKSHTEDTGLQFDASELESRPSANYAANLAENIAPERGEPLESLPIPQETHAPAGAATTTAPAAHQEEDRTMSELYTTIRALLGLGAGTPETDVVAAVGRLRDLEREAVTLTGAKSTEEAAGGIRAMHAKAIETDRLAGELAKVTSQRDKQNFDALILNGQSERKLTPALAEKVWKPEFDAAQAAGNGADVVERLRGFLNHAPIVIPQAVRQPVVSNAGSDGQPLTWNGKTYEAMSFSQRAKLKTEDPELWSLMKQDFEQRSAA